MLPRPLGGFCGVDRAAASERDEVTNCCVEGHGQLQENCLCTAPASDLLLGGKIACRCGVGDEGVIEPLFRDSNCNYIGSADAAD